ncbi:hypothetical protein Golob_011785 [Gossypium lobatum]|uniref:Uncharacterized protein n=1 Tax=Gossypium lobatum TaxID=34289 RepID=A0A7J8MQL3_9ROSI|nr:hypothetical protein [Gossypium lobatum]
MCYTEATEDQHRERRKNQQRPQDFNEEHSRSEGC